MTPTPAAAPPPVTPYTARVLPPEEWAALAGTPLGDSGFAPLPDHAGFVMVVEDVGGRVVGTWSAYGVVHLEGCWIHEAHRKSPSLLRVAVSTMFRELRQRGLTQVLTVTQTDEVAALAEHLGGQPVGQLWVIPVPEEV